MSQWAWFPGILGRLTREGEPTIYAFRLRSLGADRVDPISELPTLTI